MTKYIEGNEREVTSGEEHYTYGKAERLELPLQCRLELKLA